MILDRNAIPSYDDGDCSTTSDEQEDQASMMSLPLSDERPFPEAWSRAELDACNEKSGYPPFTDDQWEAYVVREAIEASEREAERARRNAPYSKESPPTFNDLVLTGERPTPDSWSRAELDLFNKETGYPPITDLDWDHYVWKHTEEESTLLKDAIPLQLLPQDLTLMMTQNLLLYGQMNNMTLKMNRIIQEVTVLLHLLKWKMIYTTYLQGMMILKQCQKKLAHKAHWPFYLQV